jgi:hypothetical protein
MRTGRYKGRNRDTAQPHEVALGALWAFPVFRAMISASWPHPDQTTRQPGPRRPDHVAAGAGASGLQVVAVWESKAQAERYAAEQLFPAFRESGLAPGMMQKRGHSPDADPVVVRADLGYLKGLGRLANAAQAAWHGLAETCGSDFTGRFHEPLRRRRSVGGA